MTATGSNPRRRAVLLGLLTTAALGACGRAAEEAATGRTPVSDEVRVGLVDFAFTCDAEAFAASEVTVHVTNAGSTVHDLQLRDGERVLAATPYLDPGAEATLRADLSRLTDIQLYCSVNGHAAMGMVQTLPVKRPRS